MVVIRHVQILFIVIYRSFWELPQLFDEKQSNWEFNTLKRALMILFGLGNRRRKKTLFINKFVSISMDTWIYITQCKVFNSLVSSSVYAWANLMHINQFVREFSSNWNNLQTISEFMYSNETPFPRENGTKTWLKKQRKSTIYFTLLIGLGLSAAE